MRGSRRSPDWPGGVIRESDVPCELADGVVLRADIYRRDDGQRRPVLLLRLPYGKDVAEANAGFAHPSWYALQGYVVVVQDVRGCHRSGGVFTPFLHEADDGVATIGWASRLPFCDGRVITYGSSYMGMTQLLAAVRRPPGLVAMAPTFTSSQAYEGWGYEDGALRLGFVASWSASIALAQAERAGDAATADRLRASLRDPSALLADFPDAEAHGLTRGLVPWVRDWVEHPADDEYWQRWRLHGDASSIDVPALHIAGWYDLFLRGTVRNYQESRDRAGNSRARADQRLVIGPWMHAPLAPVDPTCQAACNDLDDLQLAWFASVLDGCEPTLAPVTVWVHGSGWRELDDWPPPDRGTRTWYLHSGGRAQSRHGDGTLTLDPPRDETADVLIHEPGAPVGSVGGRSCCLPEIMGPQDQRAREDERNVVVYTSAPACEPVDLVGNATLVVFVTTDAPDASADLVATLGVVDEQGVSINVQEGIAHAWNDRRGRASSGGVYEVRVDLGPVGRRIAPGEAIRVTLAASDFPRWDLPGRARGGPRPRVANRATTQLILHDTLRPSRVVIDVLAPTDRAAPAMAAPSRSALER